MYYQDSVAINQLRNAHSFTTMTSQRTIHDLRADGKTNLAKWFRDRYDQYGMDYLCGNTSRSHGQTATAPDSDHYIVSGDVTNSGTIATDEGSLGTNDQITLADIDYAVELGETLTPPIEPAIINGEEHYALIMHPYSVTDLRLNTAASSYTSWPEIQMNAAKRGKDNPLFTGALGIYNGVVLMKNNRIYNPTGNVRRNVFMGAQAGVIAFGNAYDKIGQAKMGPEHMFSWYEDTDDYGNERGIAAGSVFGIKATLYNSKDFGKIVITSYAAKHSS